MANKKTLEEMINEFNRTLIHIISRKADIGFYEGLRHVGGPVPKGDQQRSLEEQVENDLARLRALKQEITLKLGLGIDTTNMDMEDFSRLVRNNFQVEGNKAVPKR